ncbi:MAG: hypothetical protein FK734_02925 [Asgard group archaeon]|nr:hypothetical protein [Asgard group archaeon]
MDVKHSNKILYGPIVLVDQIIFIIYNYGQLLLSLANRLNYLFSIDNSQQSRHFIVLVLGADKKW